jgi:TRAP transporter 4TM/12TM fusion protein
MHQENHPVLPEGTMTKELEELVAKVDTGGRKLAGASGKFLSLVTIAWSLFQFWYASPLPFVLNAGVLNDTEVRAIHLGVALFLAFLAYPAFRGSLRSAIPIQDWVLACLGAFAGAYLFLFYQELALRPGQPTGTDLVIAGIGLLVLLEATRRVVGAPMTVLAVVFLFYTFAGPWMPEVIAHKGASLERTLSHQWLTSEGVYGVALGVSAGYIFIFVLFGSLLDKAGAGNYMIQVSFAMLGHLRGGPAKVAVVSSGLTGLISGSSVSNVVSTGVFTIPLMKRTGYGGIKAAAIETVSSVNGQIMPPVMGAAAFLMVEYVGIPYSEIIKHAFLPATISYISLFYIVHLEALKLGLSVSPARERGLTQKLLAWFMGAAGTVAVCGLIYYVATGTQTLFGDAAPWLLAGLLAALYVYAVWVSSRCPNLPDSIDIKHPVPPQTWPTVKAGLHFLIPIGVLIWCLMVEDLSPHLSAFWATLVLVVLIVTQHALIALFRRTGDSAAALRRGALDVCQGLELGARNMIGIAIATATAGIIVGTITLTGLGLRMIDFVEVVSFGNVVLMLGFTAFVCLVLGLGVPTTANYILVASLMAPVIVELGAQSGLVIPLIAVHLFVFYFGIMGDITPPVGLASFAAAAISGGNAIKIGVQGSVYALRTVVLPFIFVFNPVMLMIDVETWGEVILVVGACILASCLFAAVTMNYFRAKCRWYEVAILALATFMLFRPDFFMNLIAPKYDDVPAAQLYEVARDAPPNGRLVLVIEGTTVEGEVVRKTVAVRLDSTGEGRARLATAGLTFANLGSNVSVSNVRFGSRAKKSGFETGWDVVTLKVRADRYSEYWFYLPALLLAGFVWRIQRRRAAGTASTLRQTAVESA